MSKTKEQQLYRDMLTAEATYQQAREAESMARRITAQKRRAMEVARKAWLEETEKKEAA
jgi:cystathionine beta-lyase/cystathionine gamma-synthase